MCCGRTRKGNINDDSKEKGSGKSLQRKTDLSRAFRDFGRPKWAKKEKRKKKVKQRVHGLSIYI